MRLNCILTQEEVNDAVADYVEKRTGRRPVKVTLTRSPGDIGKSPDTWNAHTQGEEE